MQIEITTSAAPEYCAGCASKLDTSVGSTVAIVGNQKFHLACTPDAKRLAALWHSAECPTCKGSGRVSTK